MSCFVSRLQVSLYTKTSCWNSDVEENPFNLFLLLIKDGGRAAGGLQGGCSLAQLTWGNGGVTHWTSGQFVARSA